jgi:urease accessory protein
MAITITDTGLLRLLQLSSVSLPVGGYAFSQGLEYAVEVGWVHSLDSSREWLQQQLQDALARVDLPILFRAYNAVDESEVFYCDQLALACRETRELRLTDTAMAEAILRLLPNLGVDDLLPPAPQHSFVVAFARVAKQWNVSQDAALLGYAWAWLENQVAAATKLVPLGQTQAQQLLSDLQLALPPALEQAKTLQEEDIGACLPALAIASAQHETQYTRLFRS